MFEQYFTPPSQTNLDLREKLDNSCISQKIKIYGVDEFELNSPGIAILTLNNELESEKFRNRFYSLHYGDWSSNIVDLGRFKNGHSDSDSNFAIKEIVQKLSSLGILTICIGGNSSLLSLFSYSLNDSHNFLNLVSIDKILGINSDNDLDNNNYLSELILSETLRLNFFCNLGYLRHLNSTEKIDLVKKIKFDLLSLGDLRSEIKEAEPILRNSNIVNFSLESLQSNVINYKLTSPNGFTAFEACSLSRYIGISSSMKIVGFTNVKSTIECNSILSEMVWYTIDGFNNRYNDDFSNESDFKYYHTEIDGHNLKFYQNKISNRWWVEYVSDDSIVKIEKDIIPCSENDYKLSQSSIISERIIKRLKNKII